MSFDALEHTAKLKTKQLVIGGVYVLILLLIIYGIYARLKPGPSCTDGIKDQNETGVDCGGVCLNQCVVTASSQLAVQSTGFVESGVGSDFDVYGVVANPNQTLGSQTFSYQFTVKDAGGTVLATRNGTSFILPGDTKYIIEPNLPLTGSPAKVELAISDPQWIEANEFYEKPQLTVVNKNYDQITGGVGFAEATGLLKNESPLDFSQIKLDIILKDDQGRVVALNSTVMNTVQAGENRDFRVTWPNRFSGNVANMEVQPEANIFASDAFVKKSFKQAQFQQH